LTIHDHGSASRNVPLGYLRTFLTLLVVAHHALIAYHAYAPPPPVSLVAQPRMWMAFPIVDSQRFPGVDLLIGFNDTFFMSLMFLVSGLFAWPSLARKGAGTFVRDRLLKLGLPFLVSAGLLAPLAYYPTFLSIRPQSAPFWNQWLSLGEWPAGPAWFLWVLLAFGCLAALLFTLVPNWGPALGRVVGRFADRPLALFGLLLAASALAYLPMAALFSPMHWASAGPFFVQIGRLLHYAVYFFAGAALGAFGLGRGLLASDGTLARRWPRWVLSSLGAFVLAVVTFLIVLSTLGKGGPGPLLGTFGNLTFVLSCAATSFACLALFTRFAQRPNRVADSLSENAYGIYLVHYFCVSWLQLLLLAAPLPGAAKGMLVFVGAVLLSWGLSASLRRIPMVRRVI
jgi:peptidoglycan/LPS O-acetylase OafA/YrhL